MKWFHLHLLGSKNILFGEAFCCQAYGRDIFSPQSVWPAEHFSWWAARSFEKDPARGDSAHMARTVVETTPTKKPPARKAARKPSPGRLAVKKDEKPWTAAELAEVQSDLGAHRDRLRSELNLAEHELHDLMRDAGDGAGNDQADMGSTTFERDHEMTLANNARGMLAQVEHALLRIEDGSFGVCESCGEPIGKMRVMAFPRATLCLSCKQREERR